MWDWIAADPGRLRAVLDAIPDGVIVFAVSGAEGTEIAVTMLNATARQWWRSADDPRPGPGPRLKDRLDPAQDELLRRLVHAVWSSGGVRRLRVHQPVESGHAVIDVTLARMDDGHVVASCREVTHLVEDEQLIAEAFERADSAQATLRAAVDATLDVFSVYDLDFAADGLAGARLVLMNRTGADLFGQQDAQALAGTELRELYPDAKRTGLWQAIADASSSQRIQTCRVERCDDAGAWVGAWEGTVAPVGPGRAVLIWRDVTQEESSRRTLTAANREAVHAATHDPLTGLANRALLLQTLDRARSRSCGSRRFALVYADLDNLKQINDSLGHAAGDSVLRAVATRLANLIRDDDTAARIGGDEFVLVLNRLAPGWNEEGFVERVRGCIEQPVVLADTGVSPRVSLGVLTRAARSETAEQLLHEADRAMYRDKQSRRRARLRSSADPEVRTGQLGGVP